MPRFNYTRMREFFYSWHGGQDSPLYAAASSGLVSDVESLAAELRHNAAWCEANPRAQKDCAKDARYSRRVADALPEILYFAHVNGREYLAFPWGRA